MLPLAVLALLVAAPSGSAGASSSYTKCGLNGKEQHLGTTYVTSLTKRNTTCSNAERIVKAFHACRHKNGTAGRCRSKVLGYSCTERRPSNLKTPRYYRGDVTCTNGSKGVKHQYQQNVRR